MPRITGRGLALTALAALATIVFATAASGSTQDTAPSNQSPPAIGGQTSEGGTVSASSGSWAGTTPMTFAYQWRRCDASGAGCSDISGAGAQNYAVQHADVDHTLRAQVTATNNAGSGQATSAASAKIGAKSTAPKNTKAPAISGALVQGQRLAVSNGTWSGTTPLSYRYQWLRCDSKGSSCTSIAGAWYSSYVPASTDVGHKLRVYVTAANTAGSVGAYSNTSGVIAAAQTLPPGTVKLSNGRYSIPADSVSLPNRLVVDAIQYPSGGHSRSAFTARFHVSDTRGYVVRGALVYLVGLPYAWLGHVPELATGQDGWVTLSLRPTSHTPRQGYVVMFVRARTPKGDLLAGASTRRLIQVYVRP